MAKLWAPISKVSWKLGKKEDPYQAICRARAWGAPTRMCNALIKFTLTKRTQWMKPVLSKMWLPWTRNLFPTWCHPSNQNSSPVLLKTLSPPPQTLISNSCTLPLPRTTICNSNRFWPIRYFTFSPNSKSCKSQVCWALTHRPMMSWRSDFWTSTRNWSTPRKPLRKRILSKMPLTATRQLPTPTTLAATQMTCRSLLTWMSTNRLSSSIIALAMRANLLQKVETLPLLVTWKSISNSNPVIQINPLLSPRFSQLLQQFKRVRSLQASRARLSLITLSSNQPQPPKHKRPEKWAKMQCQKQGKVLQQLTRNKRWKSPNWQLNTRRSYSPTIRKFWRPVAANLTLSIMVALNLNWSTSKPTTSRRESSLKQVKAILEDQPPPPISSSCSQAIPLARGAKRDWRRRDNE